MKENKIGGLGKKITSLCVMVGVFVCVGVSISGYVQYRDSAYKTYNEFGYEMAQIARSYIDGDRIAEYLETGTPDQAYEEMTTHLRALYENSELHSIYICVPDPADLTITNVYDTRIHKVEDPAPYAIGVVDPIGSSPPQSVVNVYLTGERSEDYFIRKSSFGYNSSAILPVLNSAGKATALVVADVTIPHIQENLNRFLFNTALITALIVLLFVAAFQVFLQRNVVRPMKLIAAEASNFTRQQNALSQKLQTVRTRDEIEQVATSVYQMECDINNYIKDITAVTAEKERIGAELDVAKQIQASMLPCIFPAFPERPELDIYATMTPAKEVGGDFYDFFLVDDDHLALVMADVSGKGVPAALFMVIAKTLIKNVAQAGLSPKSVLEKVNKQLCAGNEAEMFVTAWLGIMEISTGKLICANAGHEYPVLKRADGTYELFKDRHGFVLAGIESSRYTEYELQLQPGDRVFLYTDGVPEAIDASNRFYGIERMLAALNRNKSSDSKQILEELKWDIDAFVGKASQFDDITMLSFTLVPADIFGMQKLKLQPSLEAIERVTAFAEQA